MNFMYNNNSQVCCVLLIQTFPRIQRDIVTKTCFHRAEQIIITISKKGKKHQEKLPFYDFPLTFGKCWQFYSLCDSQETFDSVGQLPCPWHSNYQCILCSAVSSTSIGLNRLCLAVCDV